MTPLLPEVVATASRLRAAVEDTAAALAGADLDRLLASDARLQTVLHEVPRAGALALEERSRLRHEIDQAQAALRRCRRLGAVLTEFVQVSLDAQGRGAGYEPGRSHAPALTGRAVNERA